MTGARTVPRPAADTCYSFPTCICPPPRRRAALALHGDKARLNFPPSAAATLPAADDSEADASEADEARKQRWQDKGLLYLEPLEWDGTVFYHYGATAASGAHSRAPARARASLPAHRARFRAFVSGFCV
jgi:hypothetical protein